MSNQLKEVERLLKVSEESIKQILADSREEQIARRSRRFTHTRPEWLVEKMSESANPCKGLGMTIGTEEFEGEVSQINGTVIVDLYGREKQEIFTYMTMQSGIVSICIVKSSCDDPISTLQMNVKGMKLFHEEVEKWLSRLPMEAYEVILQEKYLEV